MVRARTPVKWLHNEPLACSPRELRISRSADFRQIQVGTLMKVQNSFSVPQNLQSTAGTDAAKSKPAGSAGLDRAPLPPALRHFDSTFVIPRSQQHKGGPSNNKVATGPEKAAGGPYNL